MQRAILSVSNDLFCDQRIEKVADTLKEMGFSPLLLGRKYANSPTLPLKNVDCKRLHLCFKKGAFFYAELNIRLFFHLLFSKCNLLISNDLDTLLPNLLVSKIRNIPLVYDSHEYFCGILEIQDRPMVKKTWLAIEKFCFPKLNSIITVSHSIANQYKKEYGKEVHVVRNIPRLETKPYHETRASLHLPEDKFIIILQGNAIHRERGAEEMIAALPLIHPQALLLIIGSGDVIPQLKEEVLRLNITERVIFVDRIPHDLLRNYTHVSDLGISFDKNASLNHYFSLPNKIFEYIHAGIPVITSNLPERKKIVQEYEVGCVINNFKPETIALTINTLIEHPDRMTNLKTNCQKASQILNWENEEKILQQIYQPFITKKI